MYIKELQGPWQKVSIFEAHHLKMLILTVLHPQLHHLLYIHYKFRNRIQYIQKNSQGI